MRILGAILVVGLCLAGGFGCSHPKPPPGRWEGAYESNSTMVVVRLEITSNGTILASAPNAQNIGDSSEDDRASIRQKLAQDLSDGWADAQPRDLEFDGTVFRKPGGVAPQMEWDPANKHMTMIVYFGKDPAIRIALHGVRDFSDNPWS